VNVPGVDEVVNRQELVDKIQIVSTMIRRVGFWLMILLILIAMFIISNTIRIGLVSRSGEVDIMRFVGASNSYISGPFMVEGVLLGLFGAILAGTLTLLGYYALSQSATNIFPKFSQGLLLPLDMIWKTVTIIFVGIGASIGLFGSVISIRRHLKV
jgi:cell division transport system permease protein